MSVASKPTRRRPGANPQAARPQTKAPTPSGTTARPLHPEVTVHDEPMIPLSRVQELISRQFDERLNAYGAGDLGGYDRGYDRGYDQGWSDAMAALGIAA